MKLIMAANLLAVATLVAGCVSQPHGLVLDAIGPPSPQLPGSGSNGTLMVFSAFDAHADFNDLPYLRHYTSYKIISQIGKLTWIIHNDNGTLLGGPQKVELPVGAYCVIARANGYGVVTAPVIIQANQVTMVHLEGSPAWRNGSQLSQSNPVRLPDGEIAGWRAPSANTAKP
jgi:hypothetical protein